MNLWNLLLILVLTTIVKIVKLATISGSTTCSGTNYFDSATLDCQACSTNYVSSSNNMICICPAQDYLSGSTQPLTCGTCNSGQAPLFIQTECASCASADVNSATNCGCSNNRFTSEFGTTSRALRCVDCPVGYYSSANNSPLYNCTVCAAEGQYIVSGSCSCDTKQLQQSFCVDSTTYSSTVSTTYNPTTGAQVVYNPTIGKSGLTTAQVATSDTMTYLLPQALFECINYKYSKQCQILANLCVLQMYKESTPQCSALKNLASASSTLQNSFYNDAGWKQNLPWLYYSSTGDKVIYQSNRVKAKMTLSSSSSDSARYSNIPFKLAKYALDGAFLGWETLSNQIFLCPVAYTDSPNFMKVGHSILKTCQFDLQPLVDRTLALKNLNYFFELFLVDYNGDLIDVPVLIDNFVDSSGTYPNRGSTDESKWRFVRRFFLYENISATEGTGEYLNPTKSSTYATFIHESRLVFELDRGGDETIYVPYLHLFYRTITSSLVTTQYPTEVIIVVQWKMSYSHFYDVALGFLIAIHVLVLIWVIWRAYKWILLHPQNYESAFFIFYIGVQLIYETFKIWSTLIFWFLFVCSFVWFVTFKLASAFYVLLPDNYDWVSNYRTPEIIFGCMVSIRIIVIAYEIYLQCSIDIFFLDREQRKDDPAISPNAWRLIFVANEYNEMQMMTYINIELTLFWFVFFIDGLGWDNWSTYNSKLETSQDYSNYNNVLRFCVYVMVMFVIGGIQYFMKRLLSFIFPLPYHNFVDLCSIANISVFIFDERIHGYYIHGESTGGQADVSTRDLKENLDNETRGESRNRGMLSEYPNLQTFEIYLPVKIRQLYEVVYKQAVLNEISTFRDNLSAIQNSSKLLTLSPLPKGLNIQALINQRDEMSQYFINYISQVKNYPHIAVRERGVCQLFSNLPPDRVKNMDTPLFFKDHWYGFKDVFFCSLDFEVLILLTCFYICLAIWQISLLDSTVIIYSFYKILIEFPRKFFSARNISTKTLVESRFLL